VQGGGAGERSALSLQSNEELEQPLAPTTRIVPMSHFAFTSSSSCGRVPERERKPHGLDVKSRTMFPLTEFCVIGSRRSTKLSGYLRFSMGIKRVTGIGGVFFKARDPGTLRDWYAKHLGLVPDPYGGVTFRWADGDTPERSGQTVWSPFPSDTSYFGAGSQTHMVNFRVAHLDELLATLKDEGVWIDEKREDLEGVGRFAWIKDLEGNRVELWEPAD
jgi:catechol 2,3-dioxygenase-like lactoylglutathione lyase family enzyme